MNDVISLLLTVPAALLLALVCVPNSWANFRSKWLRRSVTLIAAVQFLFAGGLAIGFATGGIPQLRTLLLPVANDLPIKATILYDGVAALMLALVSFVGWVICQYSLRYLDGEATQGRYFRWTSFTIGAVSLMVVSGNLLMFLIAWVMTSFGLHQLLLHYGHRPAARRAAWTKFTLSRLGDIALIAATVILYGQFNTLEFAELMQRAGALSTTNSALQLASFLLVFGAVTKSAQIPFHTWLPLTMETPTPVSALMHAGIVNAGGYLMIRTSSLVTMTPAAMTILAIMGGTTAVLASVIMLTQTSVKKSLAYSTIAQMGFMLLQCGLGAFSSAMLHILAHSLYKAHAFLSSGSVVAEQAASAGGIANRLRLAPSQLAMVATVIVAALCGCFAVLGIDPVTKPGGLLLGGILCLALTQWVGQVIRSGNIALVIRSMAIAVALCLIYSVSFLAVDKMIAVSLPQSSSLESMWLVATLIVLGLLSLFALQTVLDSGREVGVLKRWHIHVSNGFYLESIIRRLFAPLVNN